MGHVSVGAASRSCGPGLWDTFLFPALDPGYEISGAAFAMKPRSRGRVALSGPGAEDPLGIDHGFYADAGHLDVVAEAVETLRELARSAPVRRYAAREIKPGPEVDARDHARDAVRGFFHPVGTCAIGTVVDAECRVRGIVCVRIADASVMPTIPRVNTNLSTAAIAERVSALVLAER